MAGPLRQALGTKAEIGDGLLQVHEHARRGRGGLAPWRSGLGAPARAQQNLVATVGEASA